MPPRSPPLSEAALSIGSQPALSASTAVSTLGVPSAGPPGPQVKSENPPVQPNRTAPGASEHEHNAGQRARKAAHREQTRKHEERKRANADMQTQCICRPTTPHET